MMEKISVLIAEDNTLVRRGIQVILESQPEITVVAVACNGREAIKLTRKHHPQVVLMDISMPKLNGIEATKRIKLKSPQTQIIGLSFHDENPYTDAMKLAGAARFVTKDRAVKELVSTILAVANCKNSLNTMSSEM